MEPVGPLLDEEIDAAVRELGVDPSRLSSEQRALLSSPLNLVLLAATADDPASLEFNSPKDLFDRFSDRKQRDCRRRRDPAEVRFNAVIARLAERMSAEQRLSLPKSVLDADDLSSDADVMASEHVITFDHGKVAFFHEAFFDYAFARGWVAGDRDLTAWLLDGDQELFRRGQVRQILTHLRAVDPARFIAELRGCLNDERVRVHIKDVMLSMLSSLPSPSRADWKLVTELLEGDGWMSKRAWSLLRTERWFVRTDAEGVLADWFVSRDPEMRARAVEVARAGASAHGDRVAELLATLADPTEAAKALLWIARPPAVSRSRPLFERALVAVREGVLSDQAQQLFLDATHLEREQPSWAIELLVAWFSERPGSLAVTTMRVDALESQDYGLQRLIAGAGRALPAAFARALIPYVVSVAEAWRSRASTGLAGVPFRESTRADRARVRASTTQSRGQPDSSPLRSGARGSRPPKRNGQCPVLRPRECFGIAALRLGTAIDRVGCVQCHLASDLPGGRAWLATEISLTELDYKLSIQESSRCTDRTHG